MLGLWDTFQSRVSGLVIGESSATANSKSPGLFQSRVSGLVIGESKRLKARSKNSRVSVPSVGIGDWRVLLQDFRWKGSRSFSPECRDW